MIKKIQKRISHLDIHTLEVVKKSSASMLVKITGMVAAFVVSIILGRTVGPEGLGIINLSNRIVSVVMVFALFGMNSVVLKEISIAYHRQDWQNVRNSLYSALILILPIATILSLLLAVSAPVLGNVFFREPDLIIPLIIFSALIVPQVLSRIFASGMNGFKKIWQSNLVDNTLSAVIVTIGLLLMLLFGFKITLIRVALLYGLGRLIVTLYTFAYWQNIFPFKLKPQIRTRTMLTMALPLLLVSSTNIIASSTDTIMLGWLRTSKEVGLYNVAIQLGMLTSFFHIVTTSSLAPKIASLFAENQKKELQQMIQQVSKGLAFIGLSGVLFFSFSGSWLLSFWGIEFVAALNALLVISIGQFFNIATGATGVILIMTGYEKTIGYITFSSALINVILNLTLIPIYGFMGAAIATASTVMIENIIKVYYVKTKTGISTIPFFK